MKSELYSKSPNLKIHLVLIIIITILMLFTLCFYYYFTSIKVQENIYAQMEGEMTAIVDTIQEEIVNVFTIITAVEDYTKISNFLSDLTSRENIDNDRLDKLIDQLNDVKKNNLGVGDVWIADVDANILIRSTGHVSSDAWDFQTRPYYEKLINSDKAFIAEPWRTYDKNEYVFGVINPIRDRNGSLIGVFAFDFDLEYIDTLFSYFDDRNSFQISLVSPDNMIVYNSEKINQFVTISDISFPEDVENLLLTHTSGIEREKIRFAGVDYDILFMVSNANIPGWRVVTSDLRDTYKELVFGTFNINDFILVSFILLIYIILCSAILMRYFNKRNSLISENFDTLTGLPKKQWLFENMLSHILSNSTYRYAFVTLKIEKVLLLNELVGENKGDAFYVRAGNTIKGFLHENEIASRTGGDKFSMLLTMSTKEHLIGRLKILNKMILNTKILNENNIKLQTVYVCYELPDKDIDPTLIFDTLNTLIDHFLYKNSYENLFTFYDTNLEDLLIFENELMNDLDNAFAQNHFTFYLQGLYDILTYDLISAEALVRWKHKTKGLLPPNEFVPKLCKEGVIDKLDLYILEQVCILLNQWRLEGKTLIPISVNISALSISNDDLINSIIEKVDSYNLSHDLFAFEIAEKRFFENKEIIKDFIKSLRDNNFKVIIDNFGTGYAFLSELMHLNINAIKFDKLFYKDYTENQEKNILIKNLIDHSKKCNISPIAKGMEVENDLLMLKNIGGTIVQGNYFSKPIPIREFEKLLKEALHEETV